MDASKQAQGHGVRRKEYFLERKVKPHMQVPVQHPNRVKVWYKTRKGFSRNRNTFRYLNRLVNQIKDDKQSKREPVSLFIDFEKAFDSVLKRGLAVKMWGKRITGKFMNFLDGFMNNREIQLQVNGMKCPNQNCGECGLPQGSVIYPILFKFFLHDFEENFDDRNNIAICKFADDGTNKVSGNKLEDSMSEGMIVMEAIDIWTKRWRMVINCQKDKTRTHSFFTGSKTTTVESNTSWEQEYTIYLSNESIGSLHRQ